MIQLKHNSNSFLATLVLGFFLTCVSNAWGADISHYATGLENGTTGMNKGNCASIAVSTDAPRTGAKCISTIYTGGTGEKYWKPNVTFSVPKDSYFHVIGYAKLESSDGTSTSSSTQASIDAYVGGAKRGSAVNLTTSWQRMTARSDKAGSNKTGAEARLYRKHAGKLAVLFDDVVAYVSTNSSVDLTAPTPATSASGTGTELTWTCGTDANTGIQATMIWKRTSGTAEDLTLNNQGIYALAATEGPKVDQSGHWELIAASLAADATSYSGTFEGNEVYAIVHRDLAYNYSSPTYVTIPDLSTRTLYLKPGTNWSTKGGEVSPRFAVYCFGDGEEWFDMEAVDAGCGSGTIYKAEVMARYPNCIFCRMKGDDPENNWGNKWNKTADLTIPAPKVGIYEVPNSAWDGSNDSYWRTTPLSICVSGSWLCFAGEQLVLTATSTGATHYQWYKGGTAESNKIAGATTATYINDNFAYEDAGDYYCKSQMGDGTELTSSKFTVKTLRMYFNNGRGGGDYGYIDLHNTDPDHSKATGMIFLGQTWTYAFCVADGVGHYYGCNNPESSKMWSGNCTGWAMNADGIQCLLWSENGATYTFTVDYSNFTVPVVSAVYPPDNQAAGYKIYFDNSEVNWEDHLYFRIGRGERGATDHTWAMSISKVPGTANLYQHTTPDYTDLDAWHIADNQGNQGSGSGYSIYQTNTDDANEIKKSVTFEGGAVTQDLTIVPVGTHSTGSAGYNNHCEFYNYTMMPGMKTQNVMVDDTEHGTITVSYTDVDGNPQSFTSGDRDLAHTCILTITVTPDCGYKLSSLTVNGADFTSGDTYILDARTTIDAEFEVDTYTVNLHPNGGLILAGDVTEYAYGVGATLPTHMSKIGKDFMGWYNNSGLTGDPVTEITTTDCGNKEYWAKWENETSKVTYIIGACQVTDGEWRQGENGSYKAWLFKGGATVAENTLIATTDIKIPSLSTTSQWFLSKDVTLLPTNSMWGSASNSDASRSIRAFKVGSGSTVEFDLKEMQASGIMFYVFPSSNDAYSVDLKVNGVTESHAISAGNQYQIHRYDYFGDTYTGKFSIKGVGKESRVVVVVEVPMVTITFDKNSTDATGTMENIVAPKGSTQTLPANSFEWTNHEFRYWTEDQPGAGAQIADESKYTVTGNVTLYAQWVEHMETVVTLSASGADNDYTTSVTAVYTQAMPEVAVLPTREWYIFEGYFENPDGSGTQYYSATGESVTAWDKTTPTATIYAKWTEIKHTTITLVATGAYNHYTSSVIATLDKPMPAIPTIPLSTSAVFAGYFEDPDNPSTQYYTATGTSAKNWDKDEATYTLYAKWQEPCDIAPTLTPAAPLVTIWNDKKVDLTLATLSCSVDTTTLKYTYVSASEEIAGCAYNYFDSRVHLIGTPTGYTTTVTKTITFTFTNNCAPASTYTVEQTIRIYPEDKQARIAFILTGEENKGNFDKYTADDSTSCAELIAYLSHTYDVKCVNGYASKDEATLAAYYNQYDLLIVTDFLNTSKGYTNAIGTLIDKKPILSFEAYVANLSNWHIGSNPKDPSPKVKKMKVLCAGHAIFKDAKYAEEDESAVDVINDTDTTVVVLDALSSESKAKGLQGFTINEAPDYIFLATIRDESNKRDLIVCCERQVVFSARLMLYGINFYEMGNLSKAGRIIIRQMVDYLLMTDETKIADCSLVFDNGAGNNDFDAAAYAASGGTGTKGDGLWSTAANWAPGYNIIPTPYHPTRIIAKCHVDYDAAHAGSVKINKGRDEHDNLVDGELIVEPTGGLTIAGMVATVNDTRYASPITIAAEDLLIKADATHNGAFVYGNKESDVRATVQYYSRGTGAKTTNPEWQYMGIPFRASQTAIGMFRDAWMCRWASGSTDGLGGLWQWVENEDVLMPFEGYCITQEEKKTYEFAGKLNAPITTTIDLDNREMDDGYAFAANSWTAPIKIQEMQDADFTNAEKAIYIYHTGSYKDYGYHGGATAISAKDGGAGLIAGQYAVVPIHSSPYLTGADSVIPAMQGFFIKVLDKTQEANIKLVYNRVVYDATYFKTSTQPMRAPRRSRASGAPQVMQIALTGAHFGDKVYILSRPDFSDDFEDGWDGRKVEGNADAPMLSVVKQAGEMAVAAIPTAEERYLSFRAGEDTEYTFAFDYEGETLYLYDLFTQQATEIKTGNNYSFEATDRTPSQRFLITATPPRMPTGVETVESEKVYQPKKFIRDGQLLILHRDAVYDALGTRVEFRKEGAQ